MTSVFLKPDEHRRIVDGVNDAVAQLEAARSTMNGFAADVLADLIEQLRDELEVIDVLVEARAANDV